MLLNITCSVEKSNTICKLTHLMKAFSIMFPSPMKNRIHLRKYAFHMLNIELKTILNLI